MLSLCPVADGYYPAFTNSLQVRKPEITDAIATATDFGNALKQHDDLPLILREHVKRESP
jgi:hypothetical protein